MQVTVTVDTGTGLQRNVEINAAEPLTAGELATRLGLLLELDRTPSVSNAGRPIPDGAFVGGPRLRRGARLVLGPAGPRTSLASSVLEARVIGGPDCGLRAPLTRGTHVIGRGQDSDLVVADQDMSRRHAEISVTNAGVLVRDLSSTNGTLIDGVEIAGRLCRLEVGQLLRLGASTVTLVGASEPPAAVCPTAEGAVVVNRPPRLARPGPDSSIQFPVLVDEGRRVTTQWFAALSPAVLGIGLAAALRNVEFLAFALLSPVSLLAGAVSERRARRRDLRQSKARFHTAETDATAALAARLALETA